MENLNSIFEKIEIENNRLSSAEEKAKILAQRVRDHATELSRLRRKAVNIFLESNNNFPSVELDLLDQINKISEEQKALSNDKNISHHEYDIIMKHLISKREEVQKKLNNECSHHMILINPGNSHPDPYEFATQDTGNCILCGKEFDEKTLCSFVTSDELSDLARLQFSYHKYELRPFPNSRKDLELKMKSINESGCFLKTFGNVDQILSKLKNL